MARLISIGCDALVPKSRGRIGGVIKPRAWRHDPGSTTGSGLGCRRRWPRSLDVVGLEVTTDGSSRRSCGGVAPARRGATCPTSSAPGRRCSTDSTAGRRRGGGPRCSPHSPPTSTASGRASTAPRTAPISTLVVERGACHPRYRPFSGRGHHQGSPDRRRAGATAHVRGHGRPAPRHRARAGDGAAHAATPAARRQGL